MTKFENEVIAKLSETRTAITVKQYFQKLKVLNGGKSLTSFAFLNDIENIKEKINKLDIKFSTSISYWTAITAVLSIYPSKVKLYKQYQGIMIEKASQLKTELSKNEKTEQQEKSMISWESVLGVRDGLLKQIQESKNLDSKKWNGLLKYILIRLYTDIPPRRVQDYSYMYVNFLEPNVLDDEKNYYIVSTGEFIFNKYKTSKIYGEQRFKVPSILEDALMLYFESYFELFNPHSEFKLLVDFKGDNIHPTVGIGKLLNNAFNGPVGPTALRHIYVSEKFGKDLG